MEQTYVSPQVQYIVNDEGRRTAVVLKWEDYQSLQARISSDPELLVGLDESELRALAEGMLSLSHQERLTDLLQHNREGRLSKAEEGELNQLLAHVDSMNILKARALRTLQQLGENERD
jgi:hypothetical protein